jgi:hypothetical protein
VIWQGILELNSEFLYNNTEASETSLDVLGLLVLERKDGFLDWAESLLRNILELRFVGLKSDEEVLFHLDLVLLHEHNGLFHWVNLGNSLVLDHLDIAKVSHDRHELSLFSIGLIGLGHNLDTLGNIGDELLDVLDLLSGVVE